MIHSLKDRLKDRQPVLGMWSIISSATIAEIGILAGLDFIIFDLEHGTFDLTALEAAIRACESAGGVPLVRVPDLQPSIFQSVLDLGAHGVIVPQIRSVADAERAVRYAKYPPLGCRGYNPFTRAALYANPPNNQEGKLRNSFGLVGVIIENIEAYADLAGIATITDIDVIYLGIYDMSMALGCHGNTKHPDVLSFVQDAARTIKNAGKTIGMMVRNHNEMAAARDLGADFLVYGVDSNLFYQAISAPVKHFQQLIKS
ncbi:MAG: aldolase/citrate lyase family protein [Rhodospirillaceae bacterium]